MKNGIAISAICLAITGCASIISGTTQDIEIKSTPGASYTVTDRNGSQVAAGIAPTTVQLNRGMGYFKAGSYKINLKKPGYHPRLIDVSPSINGWYWANIAIPGNLWWMLVVDPSTGAMYKLNPEATDTPLEPNGDPLDAAGNLPTPLKTDGKVSIYDYEAQRVAVAQHCTVFGNGALERITSGADQITYRCSDQRTIKIECTQAAGCRLIP